MKRVLIIVFLAIALTGCTPKEDPGITATRKLNAQLDADRVIQDQQDFIQSQTDQIIDAIKAKGY